MKVLEKTYIGKVEALEFALDNAAELPRKGKELWIVHAIATGRKTQILGKDSNGFYLSEEA